MQFYVFCVNGGPVDYVDEWLHLQRVIGVFQVIWLSLQYQTRLYKGCKICLTSVYIVFILCFGPILLLVNVLFCLLVLVQNNLLLCQSAKFVGKVSDLTLMNLSV